MFKHFYDAIYPWRNIWQPKQNGNRNFQIATKHILWQTTLTTINKPNNDKTVGKNDQKTASTTNLGTSAGFFDVGDIERNVYGNQNFKQNKKFSSETFSLNWDQWYLYRYGQPRNPDKKCDSAARRSGNRPTPSPAWAIETPTLKEKDGKKESKNVSPIQWWMRIDQVSFCFFKRKIR